MVLAGGGREPGAAAHGGEPARRCAAVQGGADSGVEVLAVLAGRHR